VRRPDYAAAARGRLKRFRQASSLSVAAAGLLLVLVGTGAPGQEPDTLAQEPETQLVAPDTPSGEPVPGTATLSDSAVTEASRAVAEARSTIRDLAIGFAGLLPKLAIAGLLLILAWVGSRLLRPGLRRLFGSWEKGEAAATMVAISLWVLAAGAALGVIAGDARALLGSVGLIGLALSWALQAPIESFTAWLLNSFKGYYRVGDRVAVGDVFGDVYRIDFLTTTVWEAGGPDNRVRGAQPTGALTTFPNSEVLRASIVNYTRDFPYVWDEVTVGISNESDLRYAIDAVRATAVGLIGPAMKAPAAAYSASLHEAGLDYDVAPEPEVYVSPTPSWTDLTVRYLVPARELRKWSSSLHEALAVELSRPQHDGRILPSYPVTRVRLSREDSGSG
jgi:small-conductance mechanosensitive channel